MDYIFARRHYRVDLTVSIFFLSPVVIISESTPVKPDEESRLSSRKEVLDIFPNKCNAGWLGRHWFQLEEYELGIWVNSLQEVLTCNQVGEINRMCGKNNLCAGFIRSQKVHHCSCAGTWAEASKAYNIFPKDCATERGPALNPAVL